METITSRKNSRVQALRALGRDKAYRREQGLFLCDGEKLLSEALANGADIAEIYLRGAKPAGNMPDVPVYSLSEDVFGYASPLEHSPGPLFTVRAKPLPESVRPERVIVLENVQDPGNVGTVLRTLDAAGFDGCILTPGCADPFGPKALRATMGSVFRVPVCSVGNTVETVQALNARGYATLAAALDGENFYRRAPLPARLCVLIGNEGAGLTKQAQDACTNRFRLPMRGGAESLNAAVAAAVMMYDLINRE